MDEARIKTMQEVLRAHGEAEVRHDVEETMTTVCADPHYEFPTIGWKIDGREAVTEMYRRTLGERGGQVVGVEERLSAASQDALCNEIISEHQTKDGKVKCRSLVSIVFEGDLIYGERIYMDANFAKLFQDALGDDFGDVPGVSRLEGTV